MPGEAHEPAVAGETPETAADDGGNGASRKAGKKDKTAFCKVCRFASKRKLVNGGRFEAYVPFEQLLHNKPKGCQICFAVWRSLELFTGSLRHDEDLKTFLKKKILGTASYMIYSACKDHPLEVTASFKFVRRRSLPRSPGIPWVQRTVFLEIYSAQVAQTDGTPPIPFLAFGPAREVAPKLSSTRRTRLIKEWMDDCEKNHTGCRPHPVGDTSDYCHGVPRRVLDLSGNPRSRIKLVDDFDAKTMGPYATVSHPWERGDGGVLTLTTRNLVALKQGIRWSDLPPGWKDAVALASEQNIRYVWIDALCILQDDEDDFYAHIRVFSQIYARGCLNISLTRLLTVEASCLGPRKLNAVPDQVQKINADGEVAGQGGDPGGSGRRKNETKKEAEAHAEEMESHEIELSQAGRKFSVYTRQRLVKCHVAFGIERGTRSHQPYAEYNRFRPVTALAPLVQSAWAFSQRMMAARVVHLHASEMVWECGPLTRCECSPGEGRNSLALESILRSAMRVMNLADRPRFGSLATAWAGVTSHYPMLEMKDDSHRLCALAPLITRFRSRTRVDCFAGLFANDPVQFAGELLWRIKRPWAGRRRDARIEPNGSRRCRSHMYYIPTWSWVSMVTTGVDSVRRCEGLERVLLVTDDDYRIESIESEPPPGLTRSGGSHDPIIGVAWKVRITGKLLLGKIHPGFKNHPTTPFVPASLPLSDKFVPPSAPTQPAAGARELFRNRYDVIGPAFPFLTQTSFVMPQGATTTVTAVTPASGPFVDEGLPTGRPAPASLTSPKVDSPKVDSPNESTPSSLIREKMAVNRDLQHTGPNWKPPPEALPRMPSDAKFYWDCDEWRPPGEPIYAYFLLLGSMPARPDSAGPAASEEIHIIDLGLVLRRVSVPTAGPGGYSGSAPFGANGKGSGLSARLDGFERVGVFSVGRHKGYFKHAQTHSLTLV